MEYKELEPGKKEVLFLVPELAMDRIIDCYINPLNIPKSAILIQKLELEEKKTPATVRKQFIQEELIPLVKEHDIKYVVVTDGEYFKTLTGKTKVDVYLGYELPSKYVDAKIFYVPNFFRVFYQPDTQDKINFALKKLDELYASNYVEPGSNIIKEAHYITEYEPMRLMLREIMTKHKTITADIETYSLKFNKAGIATIAFAWNEHEGAVFQIDDGDIIGFNNRRLLKCFLENYQGTIIWHNIAYDATVLIFELWMNHNHNNTIGLLEGLDNMLRNWEDTKLIAYLATNSCSRVSYSLKDLAQDFAGNYAQDDIEDISKIELNQLMKYNLIDALATWHIFEKYYPIMLKDNQNDIYKKIFKPATKDIIQMQLTGLPINLERVAEVKAILEKDKEEALKKIEASPLVHEYEEFLNQIWVQKKNQTLKTKQVTLADAHEKFNPASGTQIGDLLFSFCGLVPTKLTLTGQPSTDSEALSDLLNKDIEPEVKTFLEGILELSSVDKILSAFIPAFEKAIPSSNGHWLCGNFNLGGTVSGRLSSNNPNLQNLPATGTKYAKLIKSCFQAPKGKLFIGLDFASLEDRISALTTKDHNKLKVYTDGYDGHCLRAYSYFQDRMPDVKKEYENAKDEDERVRIINSIKTRYKALRQASKGPTFALTYAGTWRTLMDKFKLTQNEAKNIERKYHELYKESDDWVKEKLRQAAKDGYITAAFGLRVRTPLLAQSVKGNKATPKEVDKEGRTAGNALGQSWCLLNSRAASEFMNQVRNHPKYRDKVWPCAQIHDAQYYVIDDDIELLLWINDVLVKCVQWQEHPDIKHDEVKLGGNLSLFFPDWAHEIEIPNNCSKKQFIKTVKES